MDVNSAPVAVWVTVGVQVNVPTADVTVTVQVPVYVGVIETVHMQVVERVGVGVKVGVFVGVPAAVVAVIVFVIVGVMVGVNVGDQHNTSALTQFEAMGGDPALYIINAWFDIVELHVFAVPNHVNDPDVRETEPILQLTTPPATEHPPPGLPT